MNKAITIGLIGLLLIFGLQHGKQETVEQLSDPGEIVQHLQFSGTIKEVLDNQSILVQDSTNEDNYMIFHLNNVLLLDGETQETLTEEFVPGQKITAYYPENTPMLLSFPGQLTPQVIVLDAEDNGFVHVAAFDETLTSSDGNLKLKLSVDTVIVNTEGEPVTSLANKTLVVFYTTSTRSIPAQTTPEKIIVLN